MHVGIEGHRCNSASRLIVATKTRWLAMKKPPRFGRLSNPWGSMHWAALCRANRPAESQPCAFCSAAMRSSIGGWVLRNWRMSGVRAHPNVHALGCAGRLTG